MTGGGEGGGGDEMRKNVSDLIIHSKKCYPANFSGINFSRSDNLNRRMKTKHTIIDINEPISQIKSSPATTFQHPFSMMVFGPSRSGKSEWTGVVLYSSLTDPSPERISWSYDQWQPLYKKLRDAKYHFYHVFPIT